MNITGTFIPPLFVFPRVRMKAELMNGAPPGSIYACHKSGWMQLEIFVEWFKHFFNQLEQLKKSCSSNFGWSFNSYNEHGSN